MGLTSVQVGGAGHLDEVIPRQEKPPTLQYHHHHHPHGHGDSRRGTVCRALTGVLTWGPVFAPGSSSLGASQEAPW